MPQRDVVLATGEIYHIYNRSVRNIPIFTNKKEYSIFLATAKFYLQLEPPIKFSLYRQQPNKFELNFSKKLVKILAFCLMSDHYHFMLRQQRKDGITKYIHRLANSYSHYFNIRHDQKGPVFESKFKSVRVINQEQLAHLSRYIHLNPVTSFLVKKPEDWEYSSYNAYLGLKSFGLVDPSDIMTNFTKKQYEEFVLDRKDYQRKMKEIGHLIIA